MYRPRNGLARAGYSRPMSDVRVLKASGEGHLHGAAEVWARATAARDGDPDVAPTEEARPIIQAVLDASPRAFVLVAVHPDERVVGFAAVRPADTAAVAEVCYVGVHPDRWGEGVGRILMDAVPEHLKSAGFSRAALLVYADNERAVTLYRRLGWRASGEPVPHPRNGRPEQRYVLDL
ncbi:GNAT family N-acetyltransferase [Embleya sp. NPDC056575]|uniref:GNAT family N-acetyltransferase n=1 Tax=unclassified Embleya TaxID=2699296 RepID=UPI003681B774